MGSIIATVAVSRAFWQRSLSACTSVFAAVLEASENRVYLENAANELSAGAAEKLVREFMDAVVAEGSSESPR